MDDGRPRVGGVQRPGAVGARRHRRARDVAREVTWEEQYPVNYHLCAQRVSWQVFLPGEALDIPPEKTVLGSGDGARYGTPFPAVML